MPDSPQNKRAYHHKYKRDWLELPVSKTISLVHATGVDEGKTKNMAKGLFLCVGGKICSGESAGLGLPVWKNGSQTVFPSLSSMQAIGEKTIMKYFSMNRFLMWRVAGTRVPVWLNRSINRIMECFVNQYMKKAKFQQPLLKLRDSFFNFLGISSTMAQGADIGLCRVFYETSGQGLIVTVDGSGLPGLGELIMLNEVDGQSFSLLRTGDSVFQDAEFPGWQAVQFDASIESPSLNLAISVSPISPEDASCFKLFCGREVALGLDWAGLAISSSRKIMSYKVCIPALSKNAE